MQRIVRMLLTGIAVMTLSGPILCNASINARNPEAAMSTVRVNYVSQM